MYLQIKFYIRKIYLLFLIFSRCRKLLFLNGLEFSDQVIFYPSKNSKEVLKKCKIYFTYTFIWRSC